MELPNPFFNGKIKTYVMCKEGDYDGVYIRYFENDSVAEEGRYMNDKKYGAWYSYYMNGNKNTLYIYIDNNPVYKAFIYLMASIRKKVYIKQLIILHKIS